MKSHDSSPAPGGHGNGPDADGLEDPIDFKKVVAVGVVSLVIFALASWWAIAILHSERASLGARGQARVPSEISSSEIGIVDQVPFQADDRLERWRSERAEWLNGYGWVDRARGLIHIPIEQAMDLAAAGAQPPPVGGPAALPGGAR